MEKIHPQAYRQKGIAFHQGGELQRAVECYRMYLTRVPGDAGIWSNLGAALRKLKRYSTAVGCYRESLRLDPDAAGTYSNLGNTFTDLNRLEESLTCHQKSLQMEPENKQYRFNLAVALRETKQFKEALEHIEILGEPDSPQYKLETAINQLYLGNFAEGWDNYEIRWETGKIQRPQINLPLWQGENLMGNHILLVSEQGYGDTLLAARNIPLLQQRGARVSLVCKQEIQPLFAKLPLEEILDLRRLSPDSLKGKYNFYSPLMSLFGQLNINSQNIPPPAELEIPEECRERYRYISSAFADFFRVGIVWSGSLTFADNDKRSAELEWFLEFAEIPGVKLFSFQKGARSEDLREHLARPLIHDIGSGVQTFGDTAAALEHMDLIIMTDSSVAHLAGSLGKPVWNLLQYKPYWLYFPETDSTPWYPSMRIFRQEKPGDWASVFQKAKGALERLVKEKPMFS